MKYITLTLLLALFFFQADAQSKSNPSIAYPKDSVIKVQIIDPVERAAERSDGKVDWTLINDLVTARYDSGFADRLVNKAQLFYYYGKDKEKFSTALVRYTDKFEDHNNLPLLNKNARMILQFSNDKAKMEEALSWSKHAVEADPGNAEYKETLDALQSKIGEN